MKLISLKIADEEGFRSLQKDFHIQFRNENTKGLGEFRPFCFAGLNGSGKSNVLEVLSTIFFYLETLCVKYLPKEFEEKFDRKLCHPDAFEIQYYIKPKGNSEGDYEKIVIKKKKNEEPEGRRINVITKKEEEINFQPLKEGTNRREANARKYLPELVVGYSSGENEILSLPFFKTRFIHYDEYVNAISPRQDYKEPESSLIYIDYGFSQAVFLSNFLMQNEKVLEVLNNALSIKKVEQFRLVLFHKRIFNKDENDSILSLLDETISKLKKCSSCCTTDEERGITYLDYFVTSKTKKLFKKHFNNDPFELFRAFQILLTLNLKYTSETFPELKEEIYETSSMYISEKVPQPVPSEFVFYFNNFYVLKENINKSILLKNFSDGEHQLMHTMGICLMLKNKNALLLLDEPETHFNPTWRSKFIKTLKISLEKGQSNNELRDILITSHSPFIISDCLPDNVILFKKDEETNYNVLCDKPDFNTYGTSVDLIMEKIFNKDQTIGDLSKKELDDLHKEVDEKWSRLDINEIEYYKNQASHLGDSLEKIMYFSKLNRLKKELDKKE